MCEFCGTYVEPGSTYCSGCGRRVAPQGDPSQQGPWQMPPPGAQPGVPWQGQPPWYGYPAPDPGIGFSVAGIVCGSIAFLFCPILLGPLGIIFAGVAMSRKERLATTAMWISVAGLVVGMLLGVIVYTSLNG